MKTHSAVLKWKAIPVCHLIRIEQTYAIPREELRPDLFRGVTVVRPEGRGAMIKGVTDRRDALDFAIRWTEARGGAQAATSTDLVKAAAIIESYLTGGLQVRVVGSDVDGNRSRLPVNDSNGFGVNAGDVFPVDDVGSVGVGIHKTVSDALDQPLSGKLVNRHEASSFAQGGEKPERGRLSPATKL
ncbi:hypothetical protein RAA17_12090 [Komagataeibacter rhaeticus]|nr:hypothetical protein [Komagataeibacter rhaeticus]